MLRAKVLGRQRLILKRPVCIVLSNGMDITWYKKKQTVFVFVFFFKYNYTCLALKQQSHYKRKRSFEPLIYYWWEASLEGSSIANTYYFLIGREKIPQMPKLRVQSVRSSARKNNSESSTEPHLRNCQHVPSWISEFLWASNYCNLSFSLFLNGKVYCNNHNLIIPLSLGGGEWGQIIVSSVKKFSDRKKTHPRNQTQVVSSVPRLRIDPDAI